MPIAESVRRLMAVTGPKGRAHHPVVCAAGLAGLSVGRLRPVGLCFPGTARRDVIASDAQVAAGRGVEPGPVFDDLVTVQSILRAPMPDGVTLLANRRAPQAADGSFADLVISVLSRGGE